jgi:hypothetical protein
VLDPAVSTRRVAVLLDRLPPYARRPGEQWSTEAELLAVGAARGGARAWGRLRAPPGKNAARPRPLPRPGIRAQSARNSAGPARGQAAAPETAGQGKTGTWADAIAALAGTPGMRRRDG